MHPHVAFQAVLAFEELIALCTWNALFSMSPCQVLNKFSVFVEDHLT
jgi:hypothetical protein